MLPASSPPSATLKYLAGYAPALQQQVQALVDEGRLGEWLARRHPDSHEVRSDKALFDYCQSLKERHLRNAPPLDKVHYDAKLRVLQHALGTHTRAPKVQGSKLRMRREIRIASLFREAPAAFLKMIVVHELAHLRELDHNKAFYQLCQHMEPDYAQLEFELRIYLLNQELQS
ncbi:M48 family metallopeptidase [Pelomonas sp. V22]|uniref:M48 metallopeptidase family protein n=1 Tax=Pelomonas sp. V22 TaxID=2822139 RepID=UPI0024A8E50B|nr:YgjP-like metallopeptidase domain-containing protein [Pelomonas sp. V22]MDI4633734.1 M48 family metallopeptidase [Pelomonas sp. V22]